MMNHDECGAAATSGRQERGEYTGQDAGDHQRKHGRREGRRPRGGHDVLNLHGCGLPRPLALGRGMRECLSHRGTGGLGAGARTGHADRQVARLHPGGGPSEQRQQDADHDGHEQDRPGRRPVRGR